MKWNLLPALIFLFHFSCAQVSQNGMDDSTAVSPGTLRIKAKILSLTETSATLYVTSVIGSGHGVINILSEGQNVIIQLPDGKLNVAAGSQIEADVKEKMGLGSSESIYILLRFRREKFKD